jgi:hypothetical protein
MAFTHPHINAYVIVGGDSDFLSLVAFPPRTKVFVVGGRAFTSVILQRNCHEFMAYENIIGARRPAPRAVTGGPSPRAPPRRSRKRSPHAGVPDRPSRAEDPRRPAVTPQTGLLKSTLLQLDSTFRSAPRRVVFPRLLGRNFASRFRHAETPAAMVS